MRRVFIALVIILSWGIFASAQDATKVEFFGGYAFSRQVGDARFGNPDRHGYEVSVTGYPIRWLGVEAAFTDNFGDEDVAPGVLFPGGEGPRPSYEIRTRLITFMAGPRVAMRGRRITPYGHFLVGGARQSTTLDVVGFGTTAQRDIALSFTVGGGVNFRLNDRVTLRLGQVDHVRADIDFHEERTGVLLRSSTSPNQIRASVGVAFTF